MQIQCGDSGWIVPMHNHEIFKLPTNNGDMTLIYLTNSREHFDTQASEDKLQPNGYPNPPSHLENTKYIIPMDTIKINIAITRERSTTFLENIDPRQ